MQAWGRPGRGLRAADVGEIVHEGERPRPGVEMLQEQWPHQSAEGVDCREALQGAERPSHAPHGPSVLEGAHIGRGEERSPS